MPTALSFSAVRAFQRPIPSATSAPAFAILFNVDHMIRDKLELPGPCLIVGLMTLTVLTMWLGIWGPLDLHQLKELQTLLATLIGAGGAIGSATIAYRAAMAKVTLDREQAAKDLLRRKTGLYLRLEFALGRLAIEAREIERLTYVTFVPPFRAPAVADLIITEPPEVDEDLSADAAGIKTTANHDHRSSIDGDVAL